MTFQRDHVDGVVSRMTRMITREDRCCTGTNSGTEMGSIVGSCLLTVDFFLTFGLGHSVLTDLERK